MPRKPKLSAEPEAARKRRQRAERRDSGMVLKQLWTREEHWPRIQAEAKRLNDGK